jgi:hypothetical protein
MVVGTSRILVVVLGALLGACAGADSGALSPPGASAAATPVSAVKPGLQPDGTYVLSPEELALSCRKLAGRTLVRILQIRDYEISRSGSVAAQHIQKAAVPIFGGTERGADPDADYRRDRAIVEAYNRRLAEKGCKTFDLVKELQPKPAAESPVLVKPK